MAHQLWLMFLGAAANSSFASTNIQLPEIKIKVCKPPPKGTVFGSSSGDLVKFVLPQGKNLNANKLNATLKLNATTTLNADQIKVSESGKRIELQFFYPESIRSQVKIKSPKLELIITQDSCVDNVANYDVIFAVPKKKTEIRKKTPYDISISDSAITVGEDVKVNIRVAKLLVDAKMNSFHDAAFLDIQGCGYEIADNSVVTLEKVTGRYRLAKNGKFHLKLSNLTIRSPVTISVVDKNGNKIGFSKTLLVFNPPQTSKKPSSN